jgi:hypothetical protein
MASISSPIVSSERPVASRLRRTTLEMSRATPPAVCARRRTSSATTANPDPALPARAASMAALRERRLVWWAIPSISSSWAAMVSAAVRVARRASPPAPVIETPCSAPASEARLSSALWVASWWISLTPAPVACTLAASTLAACAREVAASVSWSEAPESSCAVARISAIEAARREVIEAKAWPSSSFDDRGTSRSARSPAARRPAAAAQARR